MRHEKTNVFELSTSFWGISGHTPYGGRDSPTCDKSSVRELEKRASHQTCEMRRTEFFQESIGLFDRVCSSYDYVGIISWRLILQVMNGTGTDHGSLPSRDPPIVITASSSILPWGVCSRVRSAVYFSTIFVLQRYAKSSVWRKSFTMGIFSKPLHGNAVFLHRIPGRCGK